MNLDTPTMSQPEANGHQSVFDQLFPLTLIYCSVPLQYQQHPTTMYGIKFGLLFFLSANNQLSSTHLNLCFPTCRLFSFCASPQWLTFIS